MAAMGARTPTCGKRSRHYEQGMRFFSEGRYPEAITELQAALAEPSHSALTERLSRFYLAEAHSAFALARLAQDGGSPCDEATLDSLREAVTLSPNYADLQYHLGSAHLGRGEYAEAVTALRQALAINPHYAKATHALAVALYAQGEWSQGLRFAYAAITLDPTFRRPALQEATAADEAGQHAAALVALRRMSDTEGGEDALFHARLAYDLFHQGAYKEAADEYRLALTIHPGYADLRNQLGKTLYALNQYQAALAEFRQALDINPRYVEAHLNRGLACTRLKNWEEARAAFERVIELEPGNVTALETLGTLEEKQIGL